MIRAGRTGVALLALMLIPAAVSAQRDTRQTREASKFIGLAMTKQTDAERAGLYAQAMDQLRPAMATDSTNAKVWLLAGTALAGLGEILEADAAFDRAVRLHPDYAGEISVERETAWVAAFNKGIELMDGQMYAEAILAMENAQAIYSERPEALMNLGALYSNAGQYDRAIQALQDAIATTNGPLLAQLDAEQRTEWERYRMLAAANIAQIHSQQGIAAFQEERFDDAAASFTAAAELNPHARDYWFNYAQSLWALSARLEESLPTAARADSARIEPELTEIYGRLRVAAQKAREFDPNNEVLYLMEARTHRMASDFARGANREAEQAAALRVLGLHDVLQVHVDEIAVSTDAGSATITGTAKNAKAAPGSTVTLRFTLTNVSGDVVGEHDITVTMPAVDDSVRFESTASVTADAAGWKYIVVS